MSQTKTKWYTRSGGAFSLLLSGIVVSLLLTIAILVVLLLGQQQAYLTHCTEEQQSRCDLIAGALTELAATSSDSFSAKTDATAIQQEMTDYLSEQVPASGSSWAFLYDDTGVLFAQNPATTGSLQAQDDPAQFFEALAQESHAVLTTTSFSVQEHTYTIGFITDSSVYLSGSFFTYEIYLILLFASVLLLSIGVITALYGSWSRSQKRYMQTNKELAQRNRDFETLASTTANTDNGDSLLIRHSGKSNRYKQYKFKFYLNARHAIYIDGILGAMHPHTWEITLHVIKMQNNFIQFAELEKKIEAFIDQYQDRELNAVPPFDTINPTLENCCDYFKEELSKILNQEGWLFLMIEMSETPSRSYVISMIDEE